MYGVQRCLVGYSGGNQPDPTYSEMKDHTEAVLVEFDKTVVSYEQVLEKWKSISTPYDSDRQYRTAVFWIGATQEEIAGRFCDQMEFVDVEKATSFYMAETRHQDFLARL